MTKKKKGRNFVRISKVRPTFGAPSDFGDLGVDHSSESEFSVITGADGEQSVVMNEEDMMS